MIEVIQATPELPPRFGAGFPAHLDPHDVAVKLAGAGGDGAQTAAMLLTKAAINEGFDATHIPSYGPESRGGTSYADVHIARDEVLSPAAPSPHILLALNAPSLAKFAAAVRSGGIIIYDSSVIDTAPECAEGVRVYGVPCTDIARELGAGFVKNVVALGALEEVGKLLHRDALLHALREGLKSKPSMISINERAFERGVKAVAGEQ